MQPQVLHEVNTTGCTDNYYEPLDDKETNNDIDWTWICNSTGFVTVSTKDNIMFIGETVVLTMPIILVNIIINDTTRKCDRKYYTKSILQGTQTIIMSHWMTKKLTKMLMNQTIMHLQSPKQQHRQTLPFT
jgi:hypothetical protein